MSDNNDLLDHDYLRDNFLAVGFADLLVEILTTFRKQARLNLTAIQEAQAGQDWAALAETAHTLKGTAGSVGASRLANTAEQLELILTEGDRMCIARLVTELAEVLSSTDQAIATELERTDTKGWQNLL